MCRCRFDLGHPVWTLIAATTAILVAVVAASLSYAHARRLQRRQARLGRLNAQLEEIYGPLYATLEASRIAYRRLLDRLRPGQSSLFDPDLLVEDEMPGCLLQFLAHKAGYELEATQGKR
jgi:hypothetical protein